MEEATPLTIGPAPPLPEQASLPHPQLCTRQAGTCVRGRRPSPHPLQPTGRWGPFLSRPPCPVYKADGDNPFPGAAAAVAPPAPIITSLANRPRGLPRGSPRSSWPGDLTGGWAGSPTPHSCLDSLEARRPRVHSLHPSGPPASPALPPCFPLGRNTGAGSHSLLQGVFLTQGSNLGLLHCRRILCQLSLQGSPHYLGST